MAFLLAFWGIWARIWLVWVALKRIKLAESRLYLSFSRNKRFSLAMGFDRLFNFFLGLLKFLGLKTQLKGRDSREKETNHPIMGLVSTDRSVVAALLNTTP